MALIYGANASGKSNLLQAIQDLWFLMYSPLFKEDERIRMYNPFKLCYGKPIEFKIVFWIKKRKFIYNLKYNEFKILYEKLEYLSDGGIMSNVYERTESNVYKFGSTIDMKANQKNELIKETLINHTILSTLNKKNLDLPLIFHEIYEWIKYNIYKLGTYNNYVEIAKHAEKKIELKSMILDLLRKADFDITDFYLVDVPIPESLKKILEDKNLDEDSIKNLLNSRKELIFKHKTGNSEEFLLDFSMESSGTKIYFRLARILFELNNGNNIFIEDELEDSLHYDLLLQYLQTYLQIETCSQLIFTTHNQMLLDEDWMLRRDMIWLVEKDKSTSSSCLQRVSEINLHKNRSLLSAYKIGELGAKPNLGSTLLNF